MTRRRVANEIEVPLHVVDYGNGEADYIEQPSSEPTEEPPKPAPRFQRMPDLVEAIMSRAHEQPVPLTLGGSELVTCWAGGMVVVMGPTGSMKTSLSIGLALEHARERGPVVFLSREQPSDEIAARGIGMQREAAVLDVLTGRVDRADMASALAVPRMVVLDRSDATLPGLEAAIKVLRAEHPDEPILAVIDYVQIIESAERETRSKVSDVITRIDDLLRAYRAIGLVISQMSRASSRAARNGEAVGADSTDGGAESAAIERAASVTLCIGTAGPDRDDGSRAVDISIGKSRMGSGDRVVPMSANGRTGRWRIAGESRPAAEVKAERQTARDETSVRAAALAIPPLLAAAAEPMSRREIRAELGGKDDNVRAAVLRCLEAEDSEVVEVGPKKGGSWPLWTRRRAVETGRAIRPRGAE